MSQNVVEGTFTNEQNKKVFYPNSVASRTQKVISRCEYKKKFNRLHHTLFTFGTL